MFLVVLLSFLTNCLIGWLGTTALHDIFPRGNFLHDIHGPLRLLYETSWSGVTVLMLALAGFSLLFGSVVNINKFSLHSVYRDRLIRAYLGASQARRRSLSASGILTPGAQRFRTPAYREHKFAPR